jgi:hypothetical protein
MAIVILLWCVLALLALAVVAVGFAARPRATPLIYVATAIVSVVACTTAFISLGAAVVAVSFDHQFRFDKRLPLRTGIRAA